MVRYTEKWNLANTVWFYLTLEYQTGRNLSTVRLSSIWKCFFYKIWFKTRFLHEQFLAWSCSSPNLSGKKTDWTALTYKSIDNLDTCGTSDWRIGDRTPPVAPSDNSLLLCCVLFLRVVVVCVVLCFVSVCCGVSIQFMKPFSHRLPFPFFFLHPLHPFYPLLLIFFQLVPPCFTFFSPFWAPSETVEPW